MDGRGDIHIYPENIFDLCSRRAVDKIAAGIRAGLLAFSCSKCEEAPYIKEINGCEIPVETPATWLGPEEEFYNCPMRFIMANTFDLIEMMDSYKSGYCVAPDYDRQSAKFMAAVKIYERYLNHFTEVKQGK